MDANCTTLNVKGGMIEIRPGAVVTIFSQPDECDKEASRLLYLWTNGGEGWASVPSRIAALLRAERARTNLDGHAGRLR